METENPENVIRYTVILPSALNDKVESEATKERRSKAQQINWILEKYFEEKAASAPTTEPVAV